MSTSKIFGIILIGLVAVIAFLNWPHKKQTTVVEENIPKEEIAFEMQELEDIVPEVVFETPPPPSPVVEVALKPLSDDKNLPSDVDRMNQLFHPYPPLLPIVETITYSSRVDWLTGRSAFLGDYAAHYQTSKHFISRSLHGMGNYLSDIVSKGDRFNVYKKEKELEFHLVLDLSRLQLWLYYYDKDEDARVLLKKYLVCGGRLDSRRPSGSLTPLGTFLIGDDSTVYQTGMMGTFKNEPREMISVFGMRWIPLGREIANCTGSSKGLGLHGVPWKRRDETGELHECRECIGQYESGGCIRLLTEDIEELYSVIVSKPSFIHVVRDFTEAKLPGKELVF